MHPMNNALLRPIIFSAPVEALIEDVANLRLRARMATNAAARAELEATAQARHEECFDAMHYELNAPIEQFQGVVCS